MKYDYFNTNKDVSNESIGELKELMNKIKDEILNDSGLLDERKSKIECLMKNLILSQEILMLFAGNQKEQKERK